MSRIRNADWEDDENLAEDLKKYVLANLRRSEVLDFVQRLSPVCMEFGHAKPQNELLWYKIRRL